jgi:CBS domain-containing protein
MSNPIRLKRLLDITGADELDLLRLVREREQSVLAAEVLTSPIQEVVESLNELHDALITQSLKLAENELARLGLGAPPVPYAYMLYGSGGRYEQTMCSDQDSGLVYANPLNETEDEQCRTFFAKFTEVIVEHLIYLGYPPCEGSVIASNPQWCLSLRDWEKRVNEWFVEPNWENVRYLLIVADARAVAGDLALSSQLQDQFYLDIDRSPIIAQRMMENTLRHKMLVGIFGQLLTERYGENAGSLDIKYGAYIPMVNAFRLLAVQAGIRETSTLGRIEALRKAHLLSDVEASEAYDAFLFFLKMRMLTTVSNEEGQWIGTGKLSREKLTKDMILPLKKALRCGKKIQRRVQKELQHRFGGR